MQTIEPKTITADTPSVTITEDMTKAEAVQRYGTVITDGWAVEHAGMSPGDVFTVDHPVLGTLRGVAPIPFRPLHNQVVIRVLREKEYQGSIVIPEAANDNKLYAAIGVVIAKGVGHRHKSVHATVGPKPERQWHEGYSELPVQPGDYVLFARSAGEAHTFDGKPYLVTPVEHVLAVLEDYESELPAATEREFGMQVGMEKKWNRAASEMPKVEGNRGQ